MIDIAIINESTVLTAAELNAMVPALEIQAKRDLAPVWNLDPNINLIVVKADPKSPVKPAKATDWWMTILDDSDQADALGYHELTSTGYPIGKVFAKSDIADGLSVSVTFSHELMEMLVDPQIQSAEDVNGDGTEFMMREVGDAVEDDQFAYLINGVKVSDFVTPYWFRNFQIIPGTKFDFMGHVSKPLELLIGGYIGVFKNGTWSQLTNFASLMAGPVSGRVIPKKGSRRARRFQSRKEWRISTATL